MQAIELHTEIDDNGEIHLTLPVKMRTDPARVIILTEESTADAQASTLQDADAFFVELEKFSVKPRPQIAIDVQLAHERESWH